MEQYNVKVNMTDEKLFELDKLIKKLEDKENRKITREEAVQQLFSHSEKEYINLMLSALLDS